MPPKKDKLSNKDFTSLIRDHGIRFAGPVPPKFWPDQHKHHFHAIRDISAIRYNTYKNTKLYRGRVREIREKANNLLEDGNVNEATWRFSIEETIIQRFQENVLCPRCRHNNWVPDFEAGILGEEYRNAVVLKRASRTMCRCATQAATSRAVDNDDEDRRIFDFAVGGEITHAEGDNLEGISIPMQPDRVIGLEPTPTLKRHLPSNQQTSSHYPIRDRTILYPFLVIEAKKNKDVPGFRSIQKQTAFPVRRLLKAQGDLRTSYGSEDVEPFLVWFFAYQGETWRLYAGTLKKDKVRIYELWLGTIESQDDALQLLLIVDYIWSWARDIYRPSVRTCLRQHDFHSREPSLASTDLYRHSVSLQPENSPERSWPMIDDGNPVSMPLDQEMLDPEVPLILGLEGTHAYQFLRWAPGHHLSPPWTATACIRHSDFVSFTFRLLIVARDSNMAAGNHLSTLLELSSHCLLMRRNQLLDLAALWTNTQPPPVNVNINEEECVTLVFQTYCDPNNWQIHRALICIVWRRSFLLFNHAPLQANTANRQIPNLPALEVELGKKLKALQQIRPEKAVWAALQSKSLIFSPADGFPWVLCEMADIPTYDFDLLVNISGLRDLDGISIECAQQSQRLLRVRRAQNIPQTSWPELESGESGADSMLAVRLRAWPAQCPKFCLFVLLEDNYDDKQTLYKLLRKCILARSFYGEDDYVCSEEDREILRGWCTELWNAN